MERGDVFHVDLNPVQGREQGGARYVLIVSTKAFNVLGTPLVCPITQGGNFARHAGFVLCNQPRMLDLQARRARFIEKAQISSRMKFWRSFQRLSSNVDP